jgi:hypothetical protein
LRRGRNVEARLNHTSTRRRKLLEPNDLASADTSSRRFAGAKETKIGKLFVFQRCSRCRTRVAPLQLHRRRTNRARHFLRRVVIPLLDAMTLTVVAAVTAAFQQLRPTMRRSLTWDRGVEMTWHTDFTAATGLPVYFCDAYCPWRRGSNENSNACCGNTSRLVCGAAMAWRVSCP